MSVSDSRVPTFGIQPQCPQQSSSNVVVIEFSAQHLITEFEMPLLLTDMIHQLKFALANLITIVDKASQRVSSETETVIVCLQHRTKLSLADMSAEVNPNGIFSIIEEYGSGLSTVLDRLFIQHSRLDTIRPCVSGQQILSAYIPYSLSPDGFILRALHIQSEVLVMYRQQLHHSCNSAYSLLTPETCIARIETFLHLVQFGKRNGLICIICFFYVK